MSEFNICEYFDDRKNTLLTGDIKTTETEAIFLTVCLPEAGWMPARLRIGYDIFEIIFSDAYPPFLEILSWLENIIDNVQTKPLSIDDEVEDHFLKTTQTQDPRVLQFEYIRASVAGIGVYRRTLIDKQQLVETFYHVFEFFNAIDFEEEHTGVWFHFDPHSDDIIKFDLTKLKTCIDLK